MAVVSGEKEKIPSFISLGKVRIYIQEKKKKKDFFSIAAAVFHDVINWQ